ncbi:uncharacterized protein LOC126841040 [Adelges cooleyi]|uniref:uncharacterized protein LOC126841040 n=1 Tax=Adelges cooleyi TaxID=133065 RepID=UPI002180836B|nr:uncharacterized protein LOC126841040 [Adelges cooleyi]
MAMRGLTLLLVTFAFYNGAVMGANDCTLPWLAKNNPFIATVESSIMNRCPPLIGDQSKEYCCYNTEGKVECCNLQEFLVFGLICLLPILIILLILSSIISCVCCLCCPCCTIYKRRQGGRVLVSPATINYVYVETIPAGPFDNQSFIASASAESAPLLHNEYPKRNASYNMYM